jgi:hypothetical protein
MPLPVWVVAIRDPAYAYMLRSSGFRRPRAPLPWRRPKPFSQGYARAGTRLPQLTDAEIAEYQRQAEADARRYIASVDDVEERHGELIRTTVVELVRDGTATLKTSAGPIEARVIHFPKEAVVLEINFPGGRIQDRTTQSEVGRQAVHQLAAALVSTRPEAEPLPYAGTRSLTIRWQRAVLRR